MPEPMNALCLTPLEGGAGGPVAVGMAQWLLAADPPDAPDLPAIGDSDEAPEVAAVGAAGRFGQPLDALFEELLARHRVRVGQELLGPAGIEPVAVAQLQPDAVRRSSRRSAVRG